MEESLQELHFKIPEARILPRRRARALTSAVLCVETGLAVVRVMGVRGASSPRRAAAPSAAPRALPIRPARSRPRFAALSTRRAAPALRRGGLTRPPQRPGGHCQVLSMDGLPLSSAPRRGPYKLYLYIKNIIYGERRCSVNRTFKQ